MALDILDREIFTSAVDFQHVICQDHVDRVLKTARHSVPPEERARLERMWVYVSSLAILRFILCSRYKAFVSDRSGDLPVPPDAGGIGSRVSLG
jgi:peroxin-1